MSAIHICFVSMEVYPNLRPGISEEAGGAGFQLVEIAKGLRDRGHKISFVVGDYGQPFHEVIDGFDVFRANKVAHDRSITRSMGNLLRLWRAMKEARARHYVLRSTRFLSFFVMAYARLLGAKYTFMVANLPHCLRNELEDLPQLFRGLYLVSIKNAHRITVQSREQQQLFRDNFGITAPIVPNGILVPVHARPRHNAPFDFSWIASFKIQKRADILLEMARLLPRRRFLVAGGPGPDSIYSRNLMDRLRQLPNVEYLGFVPPDRIGKVYAQARLYLLTSDWEGFPNGYLYAWSQGIPTCSLKIDPDGVVTSEELGLVIDDPCDLAKQMDLLLDDEERYAIMSHKCHQYVQSHHGISTTVDRFLAALP